MRRERALWMSIFLLGAVMIGVAAGLLSWLGGMSAPNAILSAGGTFGAALALVCVVFNFLTGGTP